MKVDFKATYKELYAPKRGVFSLVTVPKFNYLMVDGEGDPNASPEYVEAIEALYSVSYTLKFHSKIELDRDYVVPPLEGLWWSADLNAFRNRSKDNWKWTMMVMLPDWLGQAEVDLAVQKVREKNPKIKVERLRVEALEEGLSVQTMHFGSYEDETPTLLKLHDDWIPQNGFKETLKHHEIYLGDPRKTEPSKLKTVLRQPVTKV
jgi:hypothetical protein